MRRAQRFVVSVSVAAFYLYSRPALAHQDETDTSTAGIQFPENTGSLPRAKMPEGSAEQPFAGEHSHDHTHGGKAHSHKHSHKHGADHDHLHDSTPEHTHDPSELGGHDHEHGEHTHGDHGHSHSHTHSHDDQAEHTHTHEHPHEHDHEHGPGTHTHGPHDTHDAPNEPQDESKLKFSFDGYLKVIGEVVENDPLSTFIGRNDGFRVGNARVGITAAYGENLFAYISLEASLPRSEDFNAPNAELTVGPRDLFLAYQLSKHAQISVGRFKAPYDIGELESEGHRIFIDAPIETRGVAPTQGFEVPGLRQGRQIGVMLHRNRIGLSEDGFDIGYALALTNGRTESFALNDNDRPAGFARFSLFFGKMINLNLGGFTDTRTTGELPNFFDEETKGAEASLVVTLGDLRVEGQILYQRTTFPTAGTPRVNAYGFHGQWSYRIWGVEAAYRFSYFDPNHRFEVDAVNEHTLGLSYYLEKMPLRVSLNATLVQEQRGRELENNRIALLAQYNF